MYECISPVSTRIRIPETASENASGFDALEMPAACRFYQENGYVLIRNLIPTSTCDAIRLSFEKTVKTYPSYLYRQTTANPEKNVFNELGYVMNPILNIQDLPSHQFLPLKDLTMKTYASQAVMSVVSSILNEPGKLVQSMYFEGNAETWAHQDTYYLDSESVGRMTAGWFALEDIDAGAGRFYVIPGSHKIDVGKNRGELSFGFSHDNYKDFVKSLIVERGFEFNAPYLSKGDALFWNAKTIHGSLPTTRKGVSRSSLTGHFIPRSHRFLQFQNRLTPLKIKTFYGMDAHCPKDLDNRRNRAILKIETTFPKAFQFAKKVAIKVVTR